MDAETINQLANKWMLDNYDPLCKKCGDHGFFLVPYGESASGTIQCSDCRGRNAKRRAKIRAQAVCDVLEVQGK